MCVCDEYIFKLLFAHYSMMCVCVHMSANLSVPLSPQRGSALGWRKRGGGGGSVFIFPLSCPVSDPRCFSTISQIVQRRWQWWDIPCDMVLPNPPAEGKKERKHYLDVMAKSTKPHISYVSLLGEWD